MTNIFVNKGLFSSNAELKEHDVRGFKLTIRANKFLFFKPKYEVIFYDVHDPKMEYRDEGKMKSVVKELLKHNEPSMAMALLFVGAALKENLRKGKKLIVNKIGKEQYDFLFNTKENKFDYTIL